MLFLCAFVPKTWAGLSCTVTGGTVTMTISDITVQRDVPLNTPLTTDLYGSAYAGWTNCSNYIGGIKSYLADSGTKDGTRKIYKTNIPGVGIDIGVYGATSNGYIATYFIGETPGWYGSDWVESTGLNGCCNNLAQTAIVKLVKIGDITSGKLSGTFGSFIVGNIAGATVPTPDSWGPEIPIQFAGTNITQLKCSISTPNLAFSLGNVSADEFGNTPGTTSMTISTKDLSLNCDPGTNINVTLSGTQSQDTTDDSVLALSASEGNEVAGGVGVQLLYGDNPLHINKMLNLKTSSGGIETLPITARYYQTKNTVIAGQANTTATLNITYQ